MFGPRERQIGNGARDAAVAIVERMDRDEPEMRESGFQHGIAHWRTFAFVEPAQESAHVPIEAFGRWAFEMDAFASYRSRNDLHGPGAVIAPRAGTQLPHAAVATREQRRMPPEQPIRRERLVVAPRGVEHHFDNAVHAAVHDVDTGHVHAETAGEGRADLFLLELLAFDGAALDRFFRERRQGGLLLQREAERLHATNQPPLLMPHGCQRVGEVVPIPTKFGPLRQFVDVPRQSPHEMRRL